MVSEVGFIENKSIMEACLTKPEYMSLQGNVAENWRRWYQRFELYMLAIEADSKPNRTKIAILLSAIGPGALERYNHFKWDNSRNDPPNNPPVPDDDNNKVTPNLLKIMPLKPMAIVTC